MAPQDQAASRQGRGFAGTGIGGAGDVSIDDLQGLCRPLGIMGKSGRSVLTRLRLDAARTLRAIRF
jgi:hypothetical protein